MLTIIFDADFLSSFLKIERCDLIRTLYQVEQAWVPAAVYRELAQTDLLRSLISLPWIQVPSSEPSIPANWRQHPVYQTLGAGERACIALAGAQPVESVVLMSDNKARRFAQSLGIQVVNIPAFLLACKLKGLVNASQMAVILQALKERDFYEFRAEVRRELLAD